MIQPVRHFSRAYSSIECTGFLCINIREILVLKSDEMEYNLRELQHTPPYIFERQYERILRVVLPVVDSHPMFFIAWSLHCFIFAMLIAGFSSQNTIFRAVTALWLVTYVINIGTILMETMWKYATSLNHARL